MPKGVYHKTKAHREAISKAMKGRKFSKEHKENLSKSSVWKGRPRKVTLKSLTQ